jgi:hypothetical protein
MAVRFAGHGAGLAEARGVATLSSLVQSEANTLAYIDGFCLNFWFAVAAQLCVALIGPASDGPFAPKRRV